MRSIFRIPIPGGSSGRTSHRRTNDCLFSNPSAGSASIFNRLEAFDSGRGAARYNDDDIMHASGNVILQWLAAAETDLRARWRGLLAVIVAATVAITTQTASAVARGSIQPAAPGMTAAGTPAIAPEAALNDAARSLLTQSSGRLQAECQRNVEVM